VKGIFIADCEQGESHPFRAARNMMLEGTS
jgi:hypothetical protein